MRNAPASSFILSSGIHRRGIGRGPRLKLTAFTRRLRDARFVDALVHVWFCERDCYPYDEIQEFLNLNPDYPMQILILLEASRRSNAELQARLGRMRRAPHRTRLS